MPMRWDIFQYVENTIRYIKCYKINSWIFEKEISTTCVVTLIAPNRVFDTFKYFSNFSNEREREGIDIKLTNLARLGLVTVPKYIGLNYIKSSFLGFPNQRSPHLQYIPNNSFEFDKHTRTYIQLQTLYFLNSLINFTFALFASVLLFYYWGIKWTMLLD